MQVELHVELYCAVYNQEISKMVCEVGVGAFSDLPNVVESYSLPEFNNVFYAECR